MITRINTALAKRRDENEKGFTLIELLVVILIIGVLAAIAIPAFLNQREGAWQSQVESDLKNAAIAATQYSVDNNGKYVVSPTNTLVGALSDATGTVAPAWDAAGFNATDDVTLTFALVGTNEYTLTGVHAQRGADKWVYSSSDGDIEFTAAP